MKVTLADRMELIKPSVIRMYAEKALAPGMITFANGNPSPATFPIAEMERFYAEAFKEDNLNSLMLYGTAVGYAPLIQALKDRLQSLYGFDFDKNDLSIVSGGTQAVDIASKILLNKDDGVIVEEPSYSSCYNIFHAYEAELIGVPMNDDGMDTGLLEEALRTHPNVKFIYTITSFHNPTGFTTGRDKREQILKLAQKYDVMVVEDDPYAELRFAGEAMAPVKSLDTEGRVLYTGSLSKVIAPGFRLGFLVADKQLSQAIMVSKQVTDIHCNSLAQYVAWKILTETDYESHIRKAQQEYLRKSSLISETLRKYMHPACRLSDPEGGMFIMMFLPDNISAEDFVWKGIDRGVVCVPGSGFTIDGKEPTHSVRLCYATVSDELIVKGAKILGEVSREMIEGETA